MGAGNDRRGVSGVCDESIIARAVRADGPMVVVLQSVLVEWESASQPVNSQFVQIWSVLRFEFSYSKYASLRW